MTDFNTKRYMVFCYFRLESLGGMNDAVGVCSSIEEAISEAKAGNYDYCDVLDMDTAEWTAVDIAAQNT